MVSSIYISSTQPRSGTLVVAIGLMEMLKGHFKNVAYFRPVVDDGSLCPNAQFMIEHFGLDMKYEDAIGYELSHYIEAFSNNQEDLITDKITAKIEQLHQKFDFVLIEGYAKESFIDILDIDINLKLASALSSAFVSVINAKDKTTSSIQQEYQITNQALAEHSIFHLCSFITRVSDTNLSLGSDAKVYLIAEDSTLDALSISDITQKIPSISTLYATKQSRYRIIKDITITSTNNTHRYLSTLQDSSLVITSSDRVDIVLSTIAIYHSQNHAYISAIVLCGELEEKSKKLLDSLDIPIVILHSVDDILDVMEQLRGIKPSLHHNDKYKVAIAKALFESAGVDIDDILTSIQSKKTDTLTPSMFRYRLIRVSQQNRQTIILPESNDERILLATQQILQRNLADIILLGNPQEVLSKAKALHIDIAKASILDIQTSPHKQKFANKLYELRKHKGITQQQAYELVCKPNYFGVMMVECGLADGMVCGAVYTTADTIRPALQIIGTQDGVDIVSSLFFMGLSSGVVVYADCAIVVDPNPNELATIAISTAKSAKAFGIEPKVAMLSYSSGDSGKGEDVAKVKEALRLVKQKEPNLVIDGPMQYDSAIDKTVASHKMPNSPVAGEANVFIFPDLNSGNNTYKAVQRSTHTTAIGPILQGLKKPVNDLSRGCSVEDIINTVMVTSILAQQKEK